MPNKSTDPRDVLTTLQKLPAQVWVRDNTDPRYINVVKRGERGYYPIQQHPDSIERFNPHEMNESATAQQVYAMVNGSMFGWEVPAADPDFWTPEEAQSHLDDLDKRAKERFAKYGAPAPRTERQMGPGSDPHPDAVSHSDGFYPP